MSPVLLVHWNAAETPERAARLRAAGFKAVGFDGRDGSAVLRTIRDQPPAAVVIDLSRLPSHGREVATVLRQQKATRLIPLVFVEGDPEKVARIRKLLPDAAYATWDDIGPALRRALRSQAARPVVPDISQGYSGTPLPKKLGISPGHTVLLVEAPAGFEQVLGADTGATIARRSRMADLILLFAPRRAALSKRLPSAVRKLADGGSIWVAWPKQASGVATDLNESAVREVCLRAGLVDYKVCAIDATWSGLKFARRKKASAPRNKSSRLR